MYFRPFPVQQTTYRIGNHVYYWVWLRPDQSKYKEHNNKRDHSYLVNTGVSYLRDYVEDTHGRGPLCPCSLSLTHTP